MKNIVIVMLVSIAMMIFGYCAGVEHAITSDGWVDGDQFVLEINHHLYTWDIDLE